MGLSALMVGSNVVCLSVFCLTFELQPWACVYRDARIATMSMLDRIYLGQVASMPGSSWSKLSTSWRPAVASTTRTKFPIKLIRDIAPWIGECTMATLSSNSIPVVNDTSLTRATTTATLSVGINMISGECKLTQQIVDENSSLAEQNNDTSSYDPGRDQHQDQELKEINSKLYAQMSQIGEDQPRISLSNLDSKTQSETIPITNSNLQASSLVANKRRKQEKPRKQSNGGATSDSDRELSPTMNFGCQLAGQNCIKNESLTPNTTTTCKYSNGPFHLYWICMRLRAKHYKRASERIG